MIPFELFWLEIRGDGFSANVMAQEISVSSATFRLSLGEAAQLLVLLTDGQNNKKDIQVTAVFWDARTSSYRRQKLSSFGLASCGDSDSYLHADSCHDYDLSYDADFYYDIDFSHDDGVYFRMETEDPVFSKEADLLIGDYLHYIQLKTQSADSELSAQLTGYPAADEKKYAAGFKEQLKNWISEMTVDDDWHDAAIAYEEIAFEVDGPGRYKDFMQRKDIWIRLMTGPQLRATHVYLGNAYCPELMPENMTQLLDHCLALGLKPVIVFPPMEQHRIKDYEIYLQEIMNWQSSFYEKHEKVELVANDWGFMAMAYEKYPNRFKLTVGQLLNKRRKDSRLQYKRGYDTHQNLFLENAFNAPFFIDFLSLEWGVDRVECESTGYRYRPPSAKTSDSSLNDQDVFLSEGVGMHSSLHLPLAQTNTGTWCPLAAAFETGERGRQKPSKDCPKYCEKWYMAYPDFLKTAGLGNSIFALDTSILENGAYLASFREAGVDRLVIGSQLIRGAGDAAEDKS